MLQTKKCNEWHFGIGAHFGVDSATKIIHSVVATAVNVHDATTLAEILHGNETRTSGDSSYQGQREIIRVRAARSKDFTNRSRRFKGRVDEKARGSSRFKSRIRARVEQPL